MSIELLLDKVCILGEIVMILEENLFYNDDYQYPKST